MLDKSVHNNKCKNKKLWFHSSGVFFGDSTCWQPHSINNTPAKLRYFHIWGESDINQYHSARK